MKELVLKNSSELRHKVRHLARACAAKSKWPCLQSITFKTRGGCIFAQGSDTNSMLQYPLGEGDLGDVAVNARAFSKVLAVLPCEDVHVSVEDDKLRIRCGNTSYSIDMLVGKELLFPFYEEDLLKKYTHCSMPWGQLRKNLCAVMTAAARDETRAIISGIYFEVEDGLTMSGTDTHRLATLHTPAAYIGDPARCVVARDDIELLLQASIPDDTDVMMHFSDSRATFRWQGGDLYCKLVDGVYPNYRRVIPEREGLVFVTANRRELLSCLNRITALSGRKTWDQQRVVFTFNKEHLLLRHIQDAYEASESLQVSGDVEMAIAFNKHYVCEFLSRMDTEKVTIGLQGSLQCATLLAEGWDAFQYVLMPMQVL